MKKTLSIVLLMISTALLPVYSANSSSSTNNDPLEKYNRAMFSFNEMLDEYFLKPVATLYNKIVPKPLARGISNMYSNAAMIPTTANDVLQGNFYQATSDAWRFAINTTAGLGGFYDVSTNIGLQPNHEDFGLTLAKWGYTDSTFIVLPLFGPSTVRDTIGMPVDYYAFSIYSRIEDAKIRDGIYLLGAVSQRASLLQYQDLYEEIAIDKYAFVRNAYLQKRANEIQLNKELSDPYYERHDYTSAAHPATDSTIISDVPQTNSTADDSDPYLEMMQQKNNNTATNTSSSKSNDPYYELMNERANAKK